jgi:hypothetical protein
MPKLIGSYATKPERVCEISLKFSSSQHYPTHFYSFKVPQTSNPFYLFPPSTRLLILLLPFLRKITQEEEPPKNSYFPSF